MSLSVDGFWKAGVWAETVWADDVWREGEYTPPADAIGYMTGLIDLKNAINGEILILNAIKETG